MFFINKHKKMNNITIALGNNKYFDDELYKIPYKDDLFIYFLIDNNTFYNTQLLKKDFEKLKIDSNELKEIAIKNFGKKVTQIYYGKLMPFRLNEEDEVIIMENGENVSINDVVNWSSFIFMPNALKYIIEKHFNKEMDKIYVAFPDKSTLIIGNLNNEKSLVEIKNQLKKYFEVRVEMVNDGYVEAKRPISDKVFILDLNTGILDYINNN